ARFLCGGAPGAAAAGPRAGAGRAGAFVGRGVALAGARRSARGARLLDRAGIHRKRRAAPAALVGAQTCAAADARTSDPARRAQGGGRALVAQALARAQGAVLSVRESNGAARALYRWFGFAQTAWRIVMERRDG